MAFWMLHTPERKLEDILKIYQLICANRHILKYCLILIGEDEHQKIPEKANIVLITITFVMGTN